jgi:membrane-associated protease RseP (regulator of RpoE activity)
MKIKIRSGLLLPLLILCLVISDRRIYTLLALSTAALHELGHILTAKATRIHLESLSLDLLGARITTKAALCSYRDEIILCAAGPLTNFIFCALAIIIRNIYILPASQLWEFFTFFAVSSAALGILNLLPIESFDGGRILYCIFAVLCGTATSEKILKFLSFVSCFLLWSFSVYLIMRAGTSLSLFAFSVSLFSRLFVLR